MSIDRWMDKDDVVHIYNRILFSHKKENKIMPFAATWLQLEIIILSEVRKTKTNTIYHLYVESKIWHKWTYLWNRNKIRDIWIDWWLPRGSLDNMEINKPYKLGLFPSESQLLNIYKPDTKLLTIRVKKPWIGERLLFWCQVILKIIL